MFTKLIKRFNVTENIYFQFATKARNPNTRNKDQVDQVVNDNSTKQINMDPSARKELKENLDQDKPKKGKNTSKADDLNRIANEPSSDTELKDLKIAENRSFFKGDN
jgi:hypothetical protein